MKGPIFSTQPAFFSFQNGQNEAGKTHNGLGKKESQMGLPTKTKGGKVAGQIGPSAGQRYTWAEKEKWPIGDDKAGPSKRPKNTSGQMNRVNVGAPVRNAAFKRRMMEGKQRKTEFFPSRSRALDKGVAAVDERQGEKLKFSVHIGGEDEFLEVICSSAKLGRDEEEILAAYGC